MRIKKRERAKNDLLSRLRVEQIGKSTIGRRVIDPVCEFGDEHCFCGFGCNRCGPHLPVGFNVKSVLAFSLVFFFFLKGECEGIHFV